MGKIIRAGIAGIAAALLAAPAGAEARQCTFDRFEPFRPQAYERAERVSLSAFSLERMLEGRIESARAAGTLLPEERIAVAVYDLRSERYLADIDAERPFQAASLVKPYVVLAVEHLGELGQARWYGPANRRTGGPAWRILAKSDNVQTNRYFAMLGGPQAVERLLRENYPFFEGEIVENIPGGGKAYRNRIPMRTHVELLRGLYNGEFPGSDAILSRMLDAKTRISHDERGRVYNKTGTTAMFYGDMGIVEGPGYAYIFAFGAERDDRATDFAGWKARAYSILQDLSGKVEEHLMVHGQESFIASVAAR